MSTFSIQQLRDKYKRIIQSEDSEQETINKAKMTFAIKKDLSHTRVLTQHCENISKSSVKGASSNSVLVALKQRIAQGLQDMAQKDKQIEMQKETIITQKAQISKLESQIAQFKLANQENNSKIIEQKVNSATLEKQIQKLKGTIKDQQAEKQLIFKQIEFYKKQIKDLRNEKRQLQQKLQQSRKQIEKVEKLRSDNGRLKENIERMQIIINQCCQQSVKMNLTDKYYLGKPLRESSCWFSQNLVGGVEAFLRKWQIGLQNKQFIDGLVKFIDQYQRWQKSSSCNKPKTKSQNKDRHSKRYSTSLHIPPEYSNCHKSTVQTSLKKSIMLNKYKKKNNRIYTQSLFEQDKSSKTRKIYEEMLDEYEKALKSVLQQTELNPKKIMLLSKELKQSFHNYMEETNTKL